MRKVDRGAELPSALDGPGSPAAKERKAARAHYTGWTAAKGSFDFKVYGDKSVRELLEKLFHGKCAYCEAVYSATAPVDVEHFRPKNAVLEDGKLLKPGYYWLASEWANLLPSCIDCNRKRYQRLDGEEEYARGKENQFPLAPGAERARKPGDEQKEEPLLLDPCDLKVDPADHLEFLVDWTDPNPLAPEAAKDKRGLVRARAGSARGKASIEVYGLDRQGLVGLRRDVATAVLATIAELKSNERLLVKLPGDPDVEFNLGLAGGKLVAQTAATAPFTAMAREITLRFYGRKVWED